jgi:hypothetical protein
MCVVIYLDEQVDICVDIPREQVDTFFLMTRWECVWISKDDQVVVCVDIPRLTDMVWNP